MRRLGLLIAAGTLWLFLAAIPALADGGPHVAAINSGFGPGSSLTSDGCAGCHRAHTGQGSNLLAQADAEELCLSCHGAAGTGATTNVEDGVQYALADPVVNGDVRGPELGALRGGGFVEARIDSSDPYRIPYMRSATAVSFHTKVSVLAGGEPVTSAHIALDGTGLVAKGIAWGQGDISATANPGTALSLECVSCHNPHGNGLYRILNPEPGDGTGAFPEGGPADVTDDAANVDVTRNYTVIQTQGGTGTLTAAQIVNGGYSATDGDYFRRTVPFDPQVDYSAPPPSGVTSSDAPNGLTSFNGEMSAWCATCHTRYHATVTDPIPQQTDSGDAIFAFRHGTSRSACTTCHVAHGSNALMPGQFSSAYPYPDASLSDSSRLLKIDNRGTCQACHDPTGTVGIGDDSGTVPVPYVP